MGPQLLRSGLAFAELSWVEALVTFHHDPWHGDQMLDEVAATIGSRPLGFDVIPGGLARSWTSMRPAVRCPWLPDSLISTSE